MEKFELLKQTLMEKGQRDLSALSDAFEMCRETNDHETPNKIRKFAIEYIKVGGQPYEAEKLYNRTLVFDAPGNFDCFMRAIERNRPMKEQFWLPRRKKLMPICQALQDMEDGKLDELFLSQPPRTGKSTIILMFMLWVMGRDSERSNLYCSFTDKAVVPFYNGLLEVLTDSVTYAYFDVFPRSSIASTNANDNLINLNRRKRYASFTGRPIGGTLNGACDCNGYIVGDDLCSGIEEALSKDRMASLWSLVDNNLIPRAKQNAKRLWIGTRWSIIDPQGIRMELLQNDPTYKSVRWKEVNIPALNERDESNFEYDYGVGFSTEYYQQRRASFERSADMASWMAQYQGQPIERDGSVFSPDDLRYYNGVLPDGDPDRVFIAIDPSWGGGDFTAGPVCFQYGDDLYIHDVVYTNGDKRISQPQIVHAALKYNASAIIIEATKTTREYTEDVDQLLRDNGHRVNVQSSISHWKNSKNKDVKGKQQRIFDRAPEIRERMVFLADGYRSKDYSLFMQNVFAFTISGKNKNDDAPDSLVIAVNSAFFDHYGKAVVFKRPF